MRIGISTTMIQRGKTGVAQHVFALVRALLEREDGHAFSLFVLKEDFPLFEFARERAELVAVPEKYRPPIANIRWHQAILPGLIQSRAIEVLHVPSYRRLLWPRPCALVGTIHDLAPFHVAGKYDLPRMFYGKGVVRFLAQRQHAIIAVSENTAADINRFFKIHRQKIHVIHNGIEHQQFLPGDKNSAGARLRTKHGIEKPFLLYVARLEHPGKNHVRLIEAFERFKAASGSDWSLVLGGSDWHGAEVIHAAIARSRYRREIFPLGFVAQQELPGLYHAAEAFVYPSLFEGFGLPPLEAMACGCPVLCSDRGALGEVVGSAAVIVNPENSDQIAEKLAEFYRRPELRGALRSRGIERAGMFRWEIAAEKTLKVYQEALEAVSGKGRTKVISGRQGTAPLRLN